MVNVHLHGPLAKEFGKVWCLDIASPIEAIQAIACTRPTIKNMIMDLHRKGLVFRVRSKIHDYDNDDVGMTLGDIARIDIIPIVKGAGPGIRAVLGVVLIAAGALGTLTPFGAVLVSAGIGLILGAVTEWLTPTPKQSSFRSLQSWTLGGPSNTVDQGLPVPVIYGEVLTGGYAISGGIIASDVAPNGSIDPFATIGGDLRPIFNTGGGGTFTVKARYSVGTINLAEPFTYAWSKTGFSGVSAVRLVNSGLATVTVEIDLTVGPGVMTTCSGVLAVRVNGKRVDGTGDATHVDTSISLTFTIDSALPVIDTGGS